jgi:hypothetical protein
MSEHSDWFEHLIDDDVIKNLQEEYSFKARFPSSTRWIGKVGERTFSFWTMSLPLELLWSRQQTKY